MRILLSLMFGLSLLIPQFVFATQPAMPTAKDRCPVCGMFVAPYPEWIATIINADGTQVFFDGCKDMLRYYFKHKEQISSDSIYVTDYYRTSLVPVDQVLFVIGSDVYGPMGHELIPVIGREAAETFREDHLGTGIYSFDQLSAELLPAD